MENKRKLASIKQNKQKISPFKLKFRTRVSILKVTRCNYLKNDLKVIIFLRIRVRKGTEMFLLWVHSPHAAQHLWLKLRPQPRAGHSTQVSHMSRRTYLLKPLLLPPRIYMSRKLLSGAGAVNWTLYSKTGKRRLNCSTNHPFFKVSSYRINALGYVNILIFIQCPPG